MSADIPDPAATILAVAWPAGVPQGEQDILASLTPDRAAEAIRRLAMLLEIERRLAAGEPVDLSPAGISRSGLVKLRRRWRERRSLKSIVQYARGGGRDTVSLTTDSRFTGMVREMVTTAPEYVGDGEIAREAVHLHGGGVSVDAALRIVRQERKRVAREPTVLADGFGRSVLVDACALDIHYETGGLVVAGLVVEQSSRLILGAQIGFAERPRVAQASAIRTARLFLRENELDVESATPSITVVAGGDPTRDADLTGRLRAMAGVQVIPGGNRRSGFRVAAALARGLGGIRMRPGSTTTGLVASARSPRRQGLTLHAAAETLAEAVGRHNAASIGAIDRAAHDDLRLVKAGSMHDALGPLEIAFG